MTFDDETLVDVKELAAHWGVSIPTARNRTKQAGFPLVLDLGPRTKRWPLLEVLKWEKNKRLDGARTRVVTGSRPQHKTGPVCPTVKRPISRRG